MTDENKVTTDTTQAVKSVKDLLHVWQNLNSEVSAAGRKIEDTLKKAGYRPNGAAKGFASGPGAASLLQQLNTLNRQSRVLVNAAGQAPLDVQLRNAEIRKAKAINYAADLQERENKRREAQRKRELRAQERAEQIGARISGTPDGARRGALEIQQRLMQLEKERARFIRGETNEYEKQKRELNALVRQQQRLTQEKRASAAASKQISDAERIRRGAQIGLGVASERVSGSGAAQTFGIQSQLTANFLVISQLTSALRFTAGFVVDFDKSLYNLQAITAASDGTMASFKDTIEEVANTTKFTAVEIANAAVVLGQAGFTAREVQQSLAGVAKFASAAGIEVTDAVNLITSALSVFNLRAAEAANVADIFTAAINQSKLTSQQLSLAFSYVANAASQSNVALSELTALLAAMANAGIRSGSTIGTNLRALFVDLQTPSEKMMRTLQSLGLSLHDIDIEANGVIGVIQNLRAAGFGATEAFGTLETRSAAAFLALSGQADTLESIQRGLVGTGAAARASDTQMKSLANTMANFQSVFGTFALKALEPTIRALQGFIENINELISTLTAGGGAADAIALLGTTLTFVAGVAAVRFLSKIFGLNAGLGNFQKEIKLTSIGLQMQGQMMTRNAQAAGVMSTGVTAATGNLLRLRSAATITAVAVRGASAAFSLIGGPVGALVLALTALPLLLSDSNDAMRKLNAELDATQTAVQKTNASFLEAQTVSSNLSQEIVRLRKQKEHLEKSEGALQAKALDLVDSYGELGLSLDSQTAKYPDLIEKVYELRDAYVAQERAAAQANAAALSSYKTGQEKTANATNALDLLGGRGNADALARLLGAEDTVTVPLGKVSTRQEQRLANFANASRASKAFGAEGLTDVAKIFDAVASGTVTALNQDTTLSSAIDELTTKYTVDGELQNKAVNDLIQNIRTLSEDLRAIDSTASNLKRAREAAEVAGLRNTPAVRAQSSVAASVAFKLQEIITESRSNPEYLLDRSKAEQNLRANGGTVAQALEDLLDPNRAGNKLTDIEFKAYRENVEQLISETIAAYNTTLEELKDDAIKSAESITRYRLGEARNDISTGLEGLRQAQNSEDLDKQKREVDEAIDRYLAYSLREAALSLGLTESQFSVHNGQLVTPDRELTVSERLAVQAKQDEAAAFGRQARERVSTQELKIFNNSLGEQIKSNKRVITALERQLRVGTDNLEPGSFGRTTLDEIQRERLDTIRRLNQIERENLELEIRKSDNLSDEDIKDRRQALADQQADRLAGVNRDYLNERRGLPARDFTDAAADLRRELIPNEFELETLSAANYFRDTMLTAADASRQGFQRFFQDVLSGQKSVGAGAREMAASILDAMLSVVTSKIAEQFLNLIVSLAFSFGGGSSGSNGLVGNDFGGASFGGTSFAAMGRHVKRRAGGGASTRDSMHYLLRPGEYVLRKSAVDAIGVENLNQINARGNATVAKASAIPTGLGRQSMEAVTNVWVVPPDQVPPPSPRDIIATVSEDIVKGGNIKKLIKSVRHGAV